MTIQQTAGKWQRLRSLTDEAGRFKMVAVDQRGSLRRAIGSAQGKSADQVPDSSLVEVKQVLTRVLAPHATAVLTDPEYGWPQSLADLPPRVGLLLAAEETGHESAGPGGDERKTHLLPDWSAERMAYLGADAAKLLLYYSPEASDEVRAYQQRVAAGVGESAEKAGLPYLLEVVTYPIPEGGDGAGFARKKPGLVTRTAEEFSKPEYKVDVLKLEFPADLKRVREYSRGAFDGQEREPVYTLAEVREACRLLDQAAAHPWVILSAGVSIEEFLAQLTLAAEAGASGFLCGRAIWKDAVPYYPDLEAMERWLSTEGTYHLLRASAVAERALPWTRHRRFAGEQAGASASV